MTVHSMEKVNVTVPSAHSGQFFDNNFSFLQDSTSNDDFLPAEESDNALLPRKMRPFFEVEAKSEKSLLSRCLSCSKRIKSSTGVSSNLVTHLRRCANAAYEPVKKIQHFTNVPLNNDETNEDDSIVNNGVHDDNLPQLDIDLIRANYNVMLPKRLRAFFTVKGMEDRSLLSECSKCSKTIRSDPKVTSNLITHLRRCRPDEYHQFRDRKFEVESHQNFQFEDDVSFTSYINNEYLSGSKHNLLPDDDDVGVDHSEELSVSRDASFSKRIKVEEQQLEATDLDDAPSIYIEEHDSSTSNSEGEDAQCEKKPCRICCRLNKSNSKRENLRKSNHSSLSFDSKYVSDFIASNTMLIRSLRNMIENATSGSTFNNRGSSRTGGLSSSSTNLCDDSGVAHTPNDISDMSVNKSVGRVMSNSSDQNIDYKRLWDTLQKDNNKLRDEVIHLKDDLSMSKRKLHSVLKQTEDGDLVNSVTGASSGAGMPSSSSNIMLSESERREKRVLQKKLAEMEEELKQLEHLKNDNKRLRDENGALIRVISKLSK